MAALINANDPTSDTWRKCTTCKKPIGFQQKYWVCSVSTCNRARTDLVFCNLACFDAHVPVMNHRDAGAFERRAPSRAEWQQAQAAASPSPASSSPSSGASSSVSSPVPGTPRPASPAPDRRGPAPAVDADHEILVVVSKVKAYIRTRHGMNTSDAVMDVLSDEIRGWLDESIRSATVNGRKTVLDRDIS